MKKYFYSVVFAAVLLMPVQASAYKIDVSDVEIQKGKKAEVSVNFSDRVKNDVYAVDLWFEYDHEAMSLDDVELGPSLKGFFKEQNLAYKPGLAKVSIYGHHPIKDTGGQLVKLHFTVRNKRLTKSEYPVKIKKAQFASRNEARLADSIKSGKLRKKQ